MEQEANDETEGFQKKEEIKNWKNLHNEQSTFDQKMTKVCYIHSMI